jgi:3-deoxy-manno-octulosonate cytidylyltransferase (CMP-KDO synthetase)
MNAPIILAIPARLKSTRLANKALLDIAGKPMIAHVIARAREFAELMLQRGRKVDMVVATDDQQIAEVARAYQIDVCMTKASHPTGTDRLHECADKLHWASDACVVNLQGDEPLMPASCLAKVVEALDQNPNAAIATLCTPIDSVAQLMDASCVKLVRRNDLRALYFSRAPIPFARDDFAEASPHLPRELPIDAPYLRHIGVYAYRVSALRTLAQAPQARIERAESLEQLRALALGLEIIVAEAPEAIPAGVDTLEDLQRVQKLFAQMPTIETQTHAVQTSATPINKARQSASTAQAPRSLLLVCMGNICRSPLSWAYAQKRAKASGWNELDIQSRGTHAVKGRGNEGAQADLRAQAIARAAGLDIKAHRTQMVSQEDFLKFDLIIAHDDRNLADLRAICPVPLHDKIKLLLEFAIDGAPADNVPADLGVPDPYMGDHEDFIRAWQLIKLGVDGMFKRLYSVS